METLTNQTPMAPAKRPLLFTVLGIFSLIGGIGSLLAVVLGTASLFLILAATENSFLSMLFIVFIIRAVVGVLLIIQGVGFLKMKKWLPTFVLVTVVTGAVGNILNFTSAAPGSSSSGTFLSIAIGVVILWLTYQQKELFKN